MRVANRNNNSPGNRNNNIGFRLANTVPAPGMSVSTDADSVVSLSSGSVLHAKLASKITIPFPLSTLLREKRKGIFKQQPLCNNS
ncbi:MAG: hypothetical protein IPJ40_13385 [Saprospirales bacterium]|nr:hypothetical protein [Saprospirales bacterium]